LTFRRQDLIVVSPGVPADVPELKQVRAMGMRIIGEMETGRGIFAGEIVGILGRTERRQRRRWWARF